MRHVRAAQSPRNPGVVVPPGYATSHRKPRAELDIGPDAVVAATLRLIGDWRLFVKDIVSAHVEGPLAEAAFDMLLDPGAQIP